MVSAFLACPLCPFSQAFRLTLKLQVQLVARNCMNVYNLLCSEEGGTTCLPLTQ